MTFHFTTCHSYLMLHGEILFFRLNSRIKNGWFIGNPNQHCRAHSRRIWARHSRDEGATSQVDQTDWGTNRSYVRKHLWILILSIATNFASSHTPTTSKLWTSYPSQGQRSTKSSSPELAAPCAYSDNHSSFWEGVPICWSCEQFREQSRETKKKSRQETVRAYSNHVCRVTSQTISEATYCTIMCTSS